MRIVAISGKKRSGKDTVANLLQLTTDKKCRVIGFATALKLEVALATGHSVQYIEENKSKFRTLLQGWADYRRMINNPSYWIDKLDLSLQMLESAGYEVVLITDLRYKNELKFLRNLGTTLVRVNSTRSEATTQDNHPSETELDNEDFPIVINNNGTIQELINQVQEKIKI